MEGVRGGSGTERRRVSEGGGVGSERLEKEVEDNDELKGGE